MEASKFRPTILISNDDGLYAKGLEALVAALRPLGNIVVVVPDGPRSGASGSITSTFPLSPKKVYAEEGLEYYKTAGTPVDCVKLALNVLFRERNPQLVVTGINHGRNDAICVIYSGTIGAAQEACIAGLPALAVSLNDFEEDADMTFASDLAYRIAGYMLDYNPPRYTMLSLNVPKGTPRGLKVCPQAITHFVDEYREADNGRGNKVYWMTGYQVKSVDSEGTDFDFLNEGFATLSPLKLDLTDHDYLSTLSQNIVNLGKKAGEC